MPTQSLLYPTRTVTVGGAGGATDTVGLLTIVGAAEISTGTEGQGTFVGSITQPGESSTAATEGQGTLSITSPGDTSAAASNGPHATGLTVGSASVTQTVGTGWTTPTAAQGIPDGAYATLAGVSGTSSATKTGTLVLSYPAAPVGTDTPSTVTLRLTFSIAGTGALTPSSLAVNASYNSGGSYTNLATYTADQALTTVTLALPGITPATLSALRLQLVGSAGGALTGAVTIQVDAAPAAFTTTGSET